MAIREEQVALKPMQFVRPAQVIGWTEKEDRGRSNPIVGHVAIAGQHRSRLAELRIDADEIAEVVVFQHSKGLGRLPVLFSWAEENLWSDQLAREGLEMPKSEV